MIYLYFVSLFLLFSVSKFSLILTSFYSGSLFLTTAYISLLVYSPFFHKGIIRSLALEFLFVYMGMLGEIECDEKNENQIDYDIVNGLVMIGERSELNVPFCNHGYSLPLLMLKVCTEIL